MTTSLSGLRFGTIREFSDDRHLGDNVEQAEAYIHELAGIVGQIVFTAENEFSVDALLSFPRFPGGAACDVRACAFWICALAQWIDHLSPEEGWTLATVKFTWS
jgi:hypothetical protein